MGSRGGCAEQARQPGAERTGDEDHDAPGRSAGLPLTLNTPDVPFKKKNNEQSRKRRRERQLNRNSNPPSLADVIVSSIKTGASV